MRIQIAIVIGTVLLFGGAQAQVGSPERSGVPVSPGAQASGPPQPLPQSAPDNIESVGPIDREIRHLAKRNRHEAVKAGTANISLNFPGVDVHEAAKAILGDILGLNYAVDPSVSGAVTVVTANPVRKSDVFPILEDSLKAANLGLVRRGAVYTIVPLAEAKRQPQLVGPSDPGYGTEAVQLHFVGAAELKKLLEPLVPENAISQVDPGRNIIIITGSAGERASIRGLIQEFDVNWLHGMSFAMFVPKHTDSKLILPQLDGILNGEGAPTAGLVKLLAVDRINGILAISAQPQYLKDVGRWIDMLDREGEAGARRLFVYRVQNGRASDLATVIVNAFGAPANSNSGATQPAPAKYANGLNRPPPIGTFQPPSNTGGSPGTTGSSTTGGSSTGSSAFDHIGGSNSDALGGEAPAVVAQSLQLSPTGPPVTLTSDDSNNAIVVYATAREYAIIEDAVHKLDIQPLQVMIEAAITEVTLTDQLQYGVQWSFGAGQAGINASGGGGAGVAGLISGVTGAPGLSYLLTYGTTINATLQALAGITKIEVLSAPRLVVLNNHTAALEVGQQVPIVTGSAVSTETTSAPIVNSVDYRDTGVILKVTPRVNDGGLVLLDISQEVSDVASTTSSAIDSPTINERKIASSIAVHDGQTVALGGLITNSNTDSSTGIPVLRHIPLLGPLLFNATNKENDRTELIVLLTPRVVRNEEDAKSMTDELKAELKTIEPDPGKVNK
ncbi:MAG TPA: type II secretion system secretin GspD [Rhizomicrobium sp.]